MSCGPKDRKKFIITKFNQILTNGSWEANQEMKEWALECFSSECTPIYVCLFWIQNIGNEMKSLQFVMKNKICSINSNTRIWQEFYRKGVHDVLSVLLRQKAIPLLKIIFGIIKKCDRSIGTQSYSVYSELKRTWEKKTTMTKDTTHNASITVRAKRMEN
jgi:hypothetical protein